MDKAPSLLHLVKSGWRPGPLVHDRGSVMLVAWIQGNSAPQPSPTSKAGGEVGEQSPGHLEAGALSPPDAACKLPFYFPWLLFFVTTNDRSKVQPCCWVRRSGGSHGATCFRLLRKPATVLSAGQAFYSTAASSAASSCCCCS